MKSINIVTSLYPYPPNFGVASEIFHTIKSLKSMGVKVYLHAVDNKETTHADELHELCERVFIYHQKRIWSSFNFLPEIVDASRIISLLKNLIQIDAPILFEGIESCFFLKESTLRNRYKIVRLDKVSSKYYLEKGRGKSKLFRWFYEQESLRFRNFESVLNKANLILTMSPNDYSNYNLKFKQKVYYLPSFHSEEKYSVPSGTGSYCLFYAKLDKKINQESAMFLIQQVFDGLPFELIIAGNGANQELRKTIQDYSHIHLKENLSVDEIRKLVKAAQINCIPAVRSSGMKHFLLHLFFNGRHVITSENELEGMGFDNMYASAKNPYDWQTKIAELMSKPISDQEYSDRYQQLNMNYNNRFNAEVLYSLILEEKPMDVE